MRKQITFEGNDPMIKALAWLSHLENCFFVKTLHIKKFKHHQDWRGDKVRVNVTFK